MLQAPELEGVVFDEAIPKQRKRKEELVKGRIINYFSCVSRVFVTYE